MGSGPGLVSIAQCIHEFQGADRKHTLKIAHTIDKAQLRMYVHG